MELSLCHAFQLTVWASGSVHMAQLCMNTCTYILQIHQLSRCDPAHYNSSLRNENSAIIYSLSTLWSFSVTQCCSVLLNSWSRETSFKMYKALMGSSFSFQFLYFIFQQWKGSKKKKKGCFNLSEKKKRFGRNKRFFQRTSELGQLLILKCETEGWNMFLRRMLILCLQRWGLEFETWIRVTLGSQFLWLETRLGLNIWDSCAIFIVSLLWRVNTKRMSGELKVVSASLWSSGVQPHMQTHLDRWVTWSCEG